MRLKKNTSNKGFTLIEMVIAMTILALVVTVLYLAFSTAGRIWGRQPRSRQCREHCGDEQNQNDETNPSLAKHDKRLLGENL